MRLRDLIFVSMIVGGGLALARTSLSPSRPASPTARAGRQPSLHPRPIVAEVDASFRSRWTEKGSPRRPPPATWP